LERQLKSARCQKYLQTNISTIGDAEQMSETKKWGIDYHGDELYTDDLIGEFSDGTVIALNDRVDLDIAILVWLSKNSKADFLEALDITIVNDPNIGGAENGRD
ncbi:hypothetical protein, partial [Paucilactobacillus hokkaidonensis]